MNTLKIYCLLASLLISCCCKSQCKLEIEITNLRSNIGVIFLQLFDNHQTIIVRKIGTIQNKKCIVYIENLKPSKYAVRYFHDENLNDKLDVNWIGIPTEGYGFSNNAYGNFGPKPFDQWLFEVYEDTKISLKTKY